MREIQFQGPKNVRDLGGLPAAGERRVRRGQIYRGDGLARMTDGDRDLFAELGITSIIDLRCEDECQRAPSLLPKNASIRTLNHGFMIDGSIEMFRAINSGDADAAVAHKMMSSNYAGMPFRHPDAVRVVFDGLLNEAELPCYIHCTSGKDRTGLICAFLLLVLGVSEADVIADYALSNVEHQAVDVFGTAARSDAVETVMSADVDFVGAALNAIRRRCQNFETYCDTYLGYDLERRNMLREKFLE